MKRGAVYLVSHGDMPTRDIDDTGDYPPRDDRSALRPVVLVSREVINNNSAVVLICPLVDAAGLPRLYPSDVHVRAPEAGLTSDCVVLTGQLRAIARTQLLRHLGELSDEVMRQVDLALRITLDLG